MWKIDGLLIVLNGIEILRIRGRLPAQDLLIVLNGIEIGLSVRKGLSRSAFNRTKWN